MDSRYRKPILLYTALTGREIGWLDKNPAFDFEVLENASSWRSRVATINASGRAAVIIFEPAGRF
ncbi:MAG: hypothetical protein A2Y69_02100 [Candidatus Aminicenantes bacterium RBG_13_59_9]|jgi:hypothetical protein|nr:MAG: hypothetical protein A2Y69_02100 [Candidatus Aminicenantes bacterium RBG_13_59_9]